MTTALSFILFTGLVAVVAWWRTHNDDQDTSTGYYLAGRSLSWFVIGGSLLLTNLSTEQLVGLNSDAYQFGMIVMAWEVWSSLAIIAMAIVFLPRYLKSGITTIPEYLELRYDSVTRSLTSVIFLASIVLNVLPFVLLSGAQFMIEVFGVPELTGTNTDWINLLVVSSLLAGVGGCYAIFGGLKAVAVSDTVNGVGLVIGGLMVPFLGLAYIGGGDAFEGVSLLAENYPERLSSVGDHDANIPWSTLFTGMTLITVYYWCTNQGIVQRTLASKSLAEGQKGVLFAALMKLAGPLYLVLPGIIAWHIAFSGDAEPPAGGANDAYAYLVNLTLPKWAVGFFAATIFGAILSSFNSFLNSGSTLFAVDLYKGVFKKSATDHETVTAGKIFGSVMIPVSVGLVLFFAPYAKGSLFGLMKSIAAVLNIPLLAIVFMGFVSKRTPAVAANVGLVAGIVFQSVFGIWAGNSVLGIEMHWLHLAALNFIFLIVLMYAIRLVMPRAVPYEQQYSEDVDITPWKLATPIGIGVMILIAAMYIGFAGEFGNTPGKQLAQQYEQLHPPEEPTTTQSDSTDAADPDATQLTD
jgi:SSS family solute:Na+ symporter